MATNGDDDAGAFARNVQSALRDEYGLSAMGTAVVQTWLKAMALEIEQGVDPDNRRLERVRRWFGTMAQRRRALPTSTWQRGCPEIIPGLRALPKWSLGGDLAQHHTLANALGTLQASAPIVRRSSSRRSGKGESTFSRTARQLGQTLLGWMKEGWAASAMTRANGMYYI